MDLRVGPLEVPTSVIEFSLLENCVRDALQARFGRDLERIRTLYAFDAIWFLYGFYMDSIWFIFWHWGRSWRSLFIILLLQHHWVSSNWRIRSRSQQRRCAFFDLFVFGSLRKPIPENAQTSAPKVTITNWDAEEDEVLEARGQLCQLKIKLICHAKARC